MLQVGDIVRVKDNVWLRMGISGDLPEGPVYWIHPAGIHRIMIKGCGWQFKQEDVELLWVDIDVEEYRQDGTANAVS
jgi:hypothetical protein